MRDSSTMAAAELLRGARRVLAITGAGISADSGLPTYRGIGGLYEGELTEDGVAIEDALSGAMLARRPDITWKYLARIESACRERGPNAAHYALAQLQRHTELCVLTQNIDGFHRAAGTQRLIEIHGSLDTLVCTGCGQRHRVRNYAGLAIPPRCPECGGLIRPDVVLFGEMLPETALRELRDFLDAGVDAVLSIGTSSVFPYIAGPVIEAARCGIPSVEINPGRTEISPLVACRIRERAAQALPALVEAIARR